MASNAGSHAGIIANAWQWLEQHLAPIDEMSRLSAQDLRLMASDLGLSERELQDAARADVDITRELHAMMQAQGLDPAVVQQRFRAVMRDIQATCTRCPNRRQCARELAAGRAGGTYEAFCGNARSFDGLNHLEVVLPLQ